MRPPRLQRLLVLATLSAPLAASAVARAQDGGMRPLPQLADSTIQRVLEQVRAPADFEVSVFAAPPHVVYPVALEAGRPGELYVAIDPNLNFDRARGRGRIVRLVDGDGDGVADLHSVFVDGLDSPRGMVFDGRTLFVAHAPTLSAFRDTDGDGVADRSEVLISGFGVGLDAEGGDHTVNGLAMGIDGWLYVAVGDYGFLKATGRDGTQLQLRGGGVVRIRPDGSEMEIYARGTRNIYDVAIDPLLNVFARDNNNNGQGWDVRLHYLPQLADAGWPALFRDFGDEILAPLAEYGAGAGTAALWVNDERLPEPYASTLYTADWGLSKVFRHPLEPTGATFRAEQEEFVTVPRPADLVADGDSDLYLASLSGGAYTYAGEHVGYVVRLRHRGRSAGVSTPVAALAPLQLAELLGSPGAVRRIEAQRELLRRGDPDADVVRRLERMALAATEPDHARAAAVFTLKQLLGAASHPVLLRVAEDDAMRAIALRALADRRGELTGVPKARFVEALSDPDPVVQAQAIIGIVRMGATGAADAVIRLASSTDPVVSHLAHNAVAELGAEEAALRALDEGDEEAAMAALRVLRRMHSPATVGALLERLERERASLRSRRLLQALARLYHRDAVWTGAWWGVLPHTDGPYHEPVAWSESPRIRPVLTAALMDARGAALEEILAEYLRHRVLPAGTGALVRTLSTTGDPLREEVIAGLVGHTTLPPRLVPALARIAERGPAQRDAVARAVAAQGTIVPASRALIRSAALDPGLSSEVRVLALAALGRLPEREGITAAAEAFARVTAEVARDTALQVAWRRFAGDRRNAREVEYFAELTRSAEEGEQVLGYAVLVQIARTAQNPAAARSLASSTIESAWADPAAAARLERAIELVNARSLYLERLEERREGVPPG